MNTIVHTSKKGYTDLDIVSDITSIPLEDGSVDVIICDLGLSKQLRNEHDTAVTIVGTPIFMAPEVH